MAKPNEKQQQQRITGFHLGGMVPLDRVGYVMAALYENMAENLQVAPHAPDPHPPQRQSRRLSDVSGVAGLLSPPSESQAAVAPADRNQVLIEIISTAPPDGLKKNEIVAALKERGISGNMLEGSVLQGLLDRRIIRRAGFGRYGLGKGATPKPTEAANGSQVSAQNKPNNKREAILLILREYGPEGAKRKEIQKKLGSHGFASEHFDAKPLHELIDSGHVTRLGIGQYAITKTAQVANATTKSQAPAANGKKTVSDHILAYLHESAPQPRTAKEITEKLNKASVGTPMSVGVELSKMFKKKTIARPSKGTYALLPA